MSKGLSQGAAWGLSIIFSVMLFSGIVALIMSIRPTAAVDDGRIEAGYEEMRRGESPKSEPKEEQEIRSDDDEGEEIRADDAFLDMKEKKSPTGPTKVS